ncbi:MAG: hypothetical protein DMG65_22015 [Candidatus Angelobacter sp. Gp1-AA117]|nr:MAG: hypothetical protein DMG65_22015 [Candidatus Angelobacter sp. Gp1-AA117]
MRKLAFITLIVLTCWFAADSARAAEIRISQNATAGQPLSIGTGGSGDGTLYLVGPGQVIKRSIKLGNDVQIKGEELRSAGRWIAIIRSGSSSESSVFWVKPGAAESMSFLARPSRVPVAERNVISGMVFVFDKSRNLVLQPTPVNFSLAVNGSGAAHTVTSRNGLAWIDAGSGPKEGAAQFVATVGGTSVRRVVQQVASQPCNLRMHVSQRMKDQMVVETDPIRDCTGNAVPDGTIVTFTESEKNSKSTVDARIKKGVARAVLPASSNATISVASGIVLGNELHAGGGE